MERIEITTSDKVVIVGDFYATSPLSGFRRGSVLLLHMMPATRGSWVALAERLVGEGIQVLAIDLRGHGESTRTTDGRTLNYRNFSDEEHQAKRHDVAAAAEWLVGERAALPNAMVVGGASIGANLALNYAAAEPGLAGVFALSPGLNYHGVTTEEQIAAIPSDRPVLLAASKEDDRASWEAVGRLSELRPGADVRRFGHSGHGTEMLEREPGFTDDLADWIRNTLSP